MSKPEAEPSGGGVDAAEETVRAIRGTGGISTPFHEAVAIYQRAIAAARPSDEPARLRERLRDMLPRVAQVFDGWHADGTAWTEWDESVRKEVSALMAALEVKP